MRSTKAETAETDALDQGELGRVGVHPDDFDCMPSRASVPEPISVRPTASGPGGRPPAAENPILRSRRRTIAPPEAHTLITDHDFGVAQMAAGISITVLVDEFVSTLLLHGVRIERQAVEAEVGERLGDIAERLGVGVNAVLRDYASREWGRQMAMAVVAQIREDHLLDAAPR